METNLKIQLSAWYQASRPPFFIATFVPLAIGWILGARAAGAPHTGRFFLTAFACFLVHLATNLANDYFDHLQGTDAGDSIGGSRVIQQGKLSAVSIRNAMIASYVTAGLIGVYLMAAQDIWGITPLMAAALFSSLFYVAPPVCYGYHGLGEAAVGINMGPVMVLGTYWVIAGAPAWPPVTVSIPVGLMVASILYFQSLPDMKTDAAAGKYTLAVRLGKKRAAHGLVFQWAVVYICIIVLTITGLLSWIGLISLLTIPVLVKMMRIIRRTRDWIELDNHGRYVRILYLSNGVIILAGLL